ncbi:MAG: metal ABC transporter permease [Erysipelotrichia bacterium]|nr:metal ABC transporter permease [Erysipelotrichia bacterium]
MFASENITAVIDVYGGALPATFLMAITLAIFGIFVVLKRMVFIGVTLSEVAACGVAFALIYELPPFVGAAMFCLLVVAILAYPYELSKLPRDTILGTIFIFASGMGILLVARSGFGLEKVKAILYGNLLFASSGDLLTISMVMIPALMMLLVFFRPILYSFLDRESAETLGISVWRYELLFFVFLGLVVAAASRIAGVMLVFCYLVVPAATALLLSRRLLPGILLSCIFAISTTILGIMTSYQADLPPNQLIAAISCCFFVIAIAFSHCKIRFSMTKSVSIAVIMIASLLWYLSGLAIITRPAEAAISKNPKTITTEAQQQTNLELEEHTNCYQQQNWPSIIEEIEQVLARDKKEGIKKAQKAIKSNPPTFFCESLQSLIEEHSD